MFVIRLVCMCLLINSVRNVELRDRKVSRLVGGHLRILNPSPDDSELLEALPSTSKEKNSKKKEETTSQNGSDEEKKTLSQQVAEGKYGLIQRELFKKPLKQPGIISYDDNPEIPADNGNNLGGLNKEDIWLAENHLLVLRGGTYTKHDNKLDHPQTWPAIDNYTAPKRPVKIPLNPKVPPPFPVQLTEDGPLQILGTNVTGSLDGPPPVYAVPPEEGGFVPGTGPFFPPYHPDQANPPAGGAAHQNPTKTQGEEERGPPFPPSLNGTLPPYFAHLPPGAVAVPPPPSINDFNEDDPSIYYPPPYSFSYPTLDNSSLVPAGPLVPGIILPPPPDFFTILEERTTRRPMVITKRPKPITTTPPVIQITLNKPLKVTSNSTVYNEVKPIITTTPIPIRPKVRPIPPRTKPKPPAVTILKPVDTIEPHITYYNRHSANVKPFPVYGPPATTKPPKIISSTQVPLKHYYSTSDDVNLNVVTIAPERSTVRSAEYYYYEEEPQTNSITTAPPNRLQNIFNLPSHYFETPKQIRPPRTQYIYVTAKPFSPQYNLPQQNGEADNFRRNIAKLKKQIRYQSPPKPMFKEIHSPKPVYQFSFQAANYKQHHQNDFRPSKPESSSDGDGGFRPMPKYSVQIQPAIDIPVNQQPLPQNPIYFRETFRTTTHRPAESQNFYTTAKPSYNYQKPTNKRGRNIQKPQFTSDSGNTNIDGYYVKPEVNYYEENQKDYSTFGQRIPNRTTALPRYSTKAPNVVYITANDNVRPKQKPISLEGDTLVNYLRPRPPINPNAQFVPIKPPQNYPVVAKYGPQQVQQYNTNLQQENRQPIVLEYPDEGDEGSFISYPLPGDNGAHFYFRTPQLIHRADHNGGYFYTDSSRNRRNSESENKR